MSGEAIWKKGTVIIVMTSGGSLATGAFGECTSADREAANDAGYAHALFELDTAATGFSGVPTSGGTINVYERKKNSVGNYAPVPGATNKAGFIGSLNVDPLNDQKYLTSDPLPIHVDGAKYYIEWVDGGSGVVSLSAAWALRLIPVTIGPAA